MNQHRGHSIIENTLGQWVYVDTLLLVSDDPNRPCGYCGLPNTPEGHDGCLGKIPNAMNACCGHGILREAYIQYTDGTIVSSDE